METITTGLKFKPQSNWGLKTRFVATLTALLLTANISAAIPEQDPNFPCTVEITEIDHACGGDPPYTFSCVDVRYDLGTDDFSYLCLFTVAADGFACQAIAESDKGIHRFEMGYLIESEREAGFEARCISEETMQSIE